MNNPTVAPYIFQANVLGGYVVSSAQTTQKSDKQMTGDEYASSLTDDHKKFGRQTLAVQKMVPDIKRILISKFDCSKCDVDELVSEVCLSMLNNRDYNAHRGCPTTYIYYKCQSAWLNHHQRNKQSREILCEDGTPRDVASDEDEPMFDPEEFGRFLTEMHGADAKVVSLYNQLRLGYHLHEVRTRLKFSNREFTEARKVLQSSGHAFFAEVA